MQDTVFEHYCREAGIDLLVLFGSSAGEAARPDSDVDLAVKMAKGRTPSKLDLIYRLGELVGDREVDLVVLMPETDAVLQFEVFRSGRPLYESRPGLFAEERLRACRRYYDTAKLRRLQADYLKAYAKGTRSVA